jgi:hypothetical protein
MRGLVFAERLVGWCVRQVSRLCTATVQQMVRFTGDSGGGSSRRRATPPCRDTPPSAPRRPDQVSLRRRGASTAHQTRWTRLCWPRRLSSPARRGSAPASQGGSSSFGGGAGLLIPWAGSRLNPTVQIVKRRGDLHTFKGETSVPLFPGRPVAGPGAGRSVRCGRRGRGRAAAAWLGRVRRRIRLPRRARRTQPRRAVRR